MTPEAQQAIESLGLLLKVRKHRKERFKSIINVLQKTWNTFANKEYSRLCTA